MDQNLISEMKRLWESRKMYRSLVENVNSIILRMDTDGIIKFINSYGESFFGFEKGELVGKNVIRTIIPETESTGRNLKWMVDDIMQNPQNYESNLNENMKKSGEKIWVLWSNKAIVDDEGKVVEIQCIGNDFTKTKLIQADLKLNEERLRLSMESSKQGWFDLNIQTGEIVVSPEYAKMIGYELEEFHSSFDNWVSEIHPLDRKRVLEIFGKCLLSKETCAIEYRRRMKDGSWKWIYSTGKVVKFDESGKPIRMTGTHMDISERKNAEENLINSEEKFSKAFRLNPNPMTISRLKDATYLDVNESFLRSTEYEREEIIGKSSLELGFVDRPLLERIIKKLAAEKRISGYEMDVPIKSGAVRKASISSEIIVIDGNECVLTVAEDVTEKRAAEEQSREDKEALQENLHFLQSLIDAIPNPIFFKDTRGIYTGCNRAFEEYLKLPREGIVGSTVFDVAPQNLAETYEKMDNELLSSGGTQAYESDVVDSFGARKNVLFNKAVHYEKDGNPSGIVGVITDITERKKAQEVVSEQAQIRLLFEVISGVVHDFNNKLVSVIGIPEIILSAYSEHLGLEMRKYVKKIRDSGMDLVSTINRLRDFCQKTDREDKAESIDINRLILGQISSTKVKWKNIATKEGKDIKIITDLGENLPPIKGIVGEIDQALTNIIYNATDAIENEGRILISSRMDKGKIVIQVSDNGCGMSQEVLKKCQELFFTTKEDKGTGIGLYSVQNAMKKHDGELDIKSVPGEGTSVFLIFQAEKGKDSSIEKLSETERRMRVLVCDDEKTVRHVLSEMLKLDHEVISAEDGLEGLKIFFRSMKPGKRPFDLVITDFGMPRRNGLSVARAIKKVKPKIPMILYTGWADLSEDEEAEMKNFQNFIFLEKPAKREELRQAIAKATGN